MWQNCRRRVWNWYDAVLGVKSNFTGRQKIIYITEAIGVMLFFALFFYKTYKAVPFMVPIGIFYLTEQEKKITKKKKSRLQKEFKDAILVIAANLRAGYAVENTFREAMREMKMLYGRDSPIYQEFYKIVQGLSNNLSIEYLLNEFAGKTELEEIQEFADVFSIAKRSGGNLTEIIYETAAIISEKIEVEKEIQVLLAEKKLEQNIMSIVPFAIVLYVGVTSAGYFDVLYDSLTGRAVMTICLAVYVTAYGLGNKVAEIQV